MFIIFIRGKHLKILKENLRTHTYLLRTLGKKKLNIKYNSCHLFFYKKGSKYNLLFNLTYFLVKY